MKVMCIESKGAKNPHMPPIFEGIVYGILSEWSNPSTGLSDAYELEEIGEGWLYPKRLFIPLSEIDETELVNEKATSA